MANEMSEQPINVQFVATFALPYALRLPDAVYKCRYSKHEFTVETRWVHESFGHSNKESKKGPPSDQNVGGTGDEDLVTGKIMFHAATGRLTLADQAYVPGALLKYTIVQVGFSRRLKGPKVTEADNLSTRDYVHKFINHFLDIYRFIANDDTIRTLSRTELHQIRAGQAFHLQSNHIVAGHGKFSMGVIFDESDPMMVGGARSLDEGQLATFRTKLIANEKPAIPALLLLNARGYLRSADFRLAIIDMNAALDIVVERKAVELLVSQGRPHEEAEDELEPKSTSSIIKNLLLPHILLEVRPTEAWDEWLSTHRRLRNKVVHDGYIPTQAEAQSSFDNVERLCNYFASLGLT